LTYQKESANQTKSLRERQLLIGQARSEIVQAIKLAPSIGRYWASYAWLVGSSGDYDKATCLFNQALKLDLYNPAIGELRDRMEELKSFKEQ
jgi:Tfp pilus assembly protein PilF